MLSQKKVKFSRETRSFNHRSYLTIVDSGQELVGAQRQLRPVVAVHSFTGVVQMLEIMWRHYGRKAKEGSREKFYLFFQH